MAFINTKTKEVQVKLVFVGPGRGGKTTNLEYIFSRIRHRIESDMVSIKTQGDRTLFFDFLPFELGAIKGYNVKTQLYTVPGQVQVQRHAQAGAERCRWHRIRGRFHGRKAGRTTSVHWKTSRRISRFTISIIASIPLVFQYNKRDLATEGIDILDIETLEKDLNSQLKAPSFTASALKGENVIPTVKKGHLHDDCGPSG